jgi:hypothetical protein
MVPRLSVASIALVVILGFLRNESLSRSGSADYPLLAGKTNLAEDLAVVKRVSRQDKMCKVLVLFYLACGVEGIIAAKYSGIKVIALSRRTRRCTKGKIETATAHKADATGDPLPRW